MERSHNVLKRVWKNFDIVGYKNELKDIDWTILVNIANSFLVEKITGPLDVSAPMQRIQQRKNTKTG